MAISSVPPAGPPCVMFQIMSKYLSEPIMDMVQAVLKMGPRSGIAILNRYCRRVAPSIIAAS